MSDILQDERINEALLTLLEGIEREDETLRLQQMRKFKKNNLFWHGFQYLFWSEADSDWRIPTRDQVEEISGREETRYIFDYVVNVFKAHGESIIAALSVDIPEVRFGPRDAQDPNDTRAVDAASNAVELINKWNRAKLLIIQALFYLSTEGFVASYTYNRKDAAYGQVKIPQYTSEKRLSEVCTDCGAETAGQEVCPTCGGMVSQVEEDVPVLIGEDLIPKGREVIEIYGALSVRVPAHVSKQADAGYLIHYNDADPAAFVEAYNDPEINADESQSYDRSMRQSSLSMDGYETTLRLATEKRCWLRRWMFNRLDKTYEDIVELLKSQYPNGVYFCAIGKKICAKRPESMDDHWTLTKAGPSKGVHADPLLQSIVPLQEMHNNLINLFQMQVEYGVPATYADEEVFDFDGQAKQESAPGYIYPVTPRPGQSIADAFHTEKTTTLSKESTQLLDFIMTSEQFCSGSFPSIYGGPAQSGSKTLGEYEKSRSFALQRLSLVWYFINVWYGETAHKAVLSFIDHQVEDEPLTTKVPTTGKWQTKWVKKADFVGSFDRLEPDVSTDFPMSFGQKRQVVSNLLQLNNPEINSVLFAPENARIVQSYVGLTELNIPNEDQRNKQMREILILIGMGPIEDGTEIVGSVPVEPDIDDHEVHIDICRTFLISNSGQDLKESNMRAYANVLAHLLEHKKYLMMLTAPPPMAPAPNKEVSKPNGVATQ